MAKETKIQWCDTTVNPVMGCDGCELWPSRSQIRNAVLEHLEQEMKVPVDGRHRAMVAQILEECGDFATDVYHRRSTAADAILARVMSQETNVSRKDRDALARAIANEFRCYAGILHAHRGEDDAKPDKGVNAGYARKFEMPKLFPGRTAEAANWSDLTGSSRPDRSWLDGLPRLIFVSDMGDALSSDVPFEYLRTEIIDVAASENGQRHIWLWLTKRPAVMAQFSSWLESRGVGWPENLVAMTSVTSENTTRRIDQLRRVNCRYRGVSIEPLWGPVEPDLTGIDWAIVGGESGGGAKPFELQWARSLRDRCAENGVAFFVKQLGKSPFDLGRRMVLSDAHGGDWNEWPEDLRIREFPVDWSDPAEMVSGRSSTLANTNLEVIIIS